MVRVIEGKIIMENELRVNENWFESEREFELSRVRVTEGKNYSDAGEIDFGSS